MQNELPPLSRVPQVAVIDYGMGNLRSVIKALETVGAEVRLIENPDEVGRAEALFFPGQGAIGGCIRRLNQTGFSDLLRGWIREGRPYFGICLGLQALFERSEEGDEPALGIFPGVIRRFPSDQGLKIPHMGWNRTLWSNPAEPLLEGLPPEDSWFYFVHSYRLVDADEDLAWARTEYGKDRFISAIRRGNCVATQFHPEKSQFYGLRLYRNFLEVICQL